MKKQKDSNYLEFIPLKNPSIKWSNDENGIVTLQKQNKGIVNAVAQRLLKKPKVSYIHLEEMGSFIWLAIDGKTSIFDIGKQVKEKFGEDCEPLYQRLSQYIKTLESYSFISYNK